MPSEQWAKRASKLKQSFCSCIAPSAAREGDMLSISMRALIFPCLMWITSCFAASVTQSGVTPLILRASNATTRFSIRSSNFCNFTPRIHQKGSQVRNPKFSSVGGGCSQIPLAGMHYACFNRILDGTPLFKILYPPLHVGLIFWHLSKLSTCSIRFLFSQIFAKLNKGRESTICVTQMQSYCKFLLLRLPFSALLWV